MGRPKLPRPQERPGTGAETEPPGAIRKADHPEITPRHPGPNDDADPERTMDEPQKGEKGRGKPAAGKR